MTDDERLAAQFEAQRPRLRAIAYRVLGSGADADDALQNAWLRARTAHLDQVEDVPAWLTTVVARVSLNALRTRSRRAERTLDDVPSGPAARADGPEDQAVTAEAVGMAMLVVLDTLSPAERLAFVLHDMFALPFDDVAGVLRTTPAAARQQASRARRKVRGAELGRSEGLAGRRRLVTAYLDAIRAGDLDALVRLLHPDVTLDADAAAVPGGRAARLTGSDVVARGALASLSRALDSVVVLVDGEPGIVMARDGRPRVALLIAVGDGLITHVEVVGDPDRLSRLSLALPD